MVTISGLVSGCSRRKLPLLLVILLGFKLSCITRRFLSPPPVIAPVDVTYNPKTLLNQITSTFTIIESSNITFLLEPRASLCSPSTSLLLLTLSSLGHRHQRRVFRAMVAEVPGVVVVFLVAESATVEVQVEVEEEQAEHGDLLQVSDPESYARLSYKTLSGLLWAGLHCPNIPHVAKTDDDATLNLPALLIQLRSRTEDFMACPNPSRNFRPTRTSRPASQTGKWSPSWAEMGRRTWPDFCFGWLWVTTPRVGVALAEVAARLEPDMLHLAKWDDSFVTGFLRERLGLRLSGLAPGWRGWLWDRVLSSCTPLSLCSNHLLNDLVLSKGPPAMPYVNNWTFFLCIHLEPKLGWLHELLPEATPLLAPLWDICARR